MTQIADSPRAHKLRGSGHGTHEAFQQADVLVHGLSMFAGEPSPLPVRAGQAAPAPEAGEHGVLEPGALGAGDDVLSAVWRTSSYLESVQWELDAAQGSLLRAVQQAALAGIGHDELCRAANMTPRELAAALQELPPAA